MNCELSPIPVMLKSPFRGLGDCPFLGVGTARSNLPAILPLFFCYHPHFQYHAIFLAAPPHTLKRQKAAKSGKKRQETAILYPSQWAWSNDYTPNPCFVCKSVQKLPFTVQKCAINLSDMEKTITNKNAHYQIPTTNYQLKICFHCAKVCNSL